MKRKTPKTHWQTGTQSLGDMQNSYIAKFMVYDRDGVCLYVERKKDKLFPEEFYYFLDLDIDLTHDITISFLKREHIQVWFSFKLPPQESNQRSHVVRFPNILNFQSVGYRLNLFEAHVHSDTVVFGYTAHDGNPKEFRFSLANFNEKYLEQFV